MKKLLSRILKRYASRELAPQLTRYQRQALQQPGPAVGGLPYTTYAAMEADSMIQTALTLKKLGVLASEWSIVPGGTTTSARKKADFVEEVFMRMEGSPQTILEDAMNAFTYGWSIQELIYAYDQGRWWIETTRPKDPAMFGLKMDRFGRLEALNLEIPGEEKLELPPSKFVVYANRGGYGRAKGKSDLDAAYFHYAAKASLLNAWKVHLEKFASPTMLSSFASTTSTSDREEVYSALQNIATQGVVQFPNEFEVSAIGGQNEASRGFMEAIEFHNREIARAILGQTLTTDEGRRVGSLALGKVHLQVLVLQLEAIRKDLADRVMTEQVIRPLIELNFGPGELPRFEFKSAQVEAFRSGVLN